MSGVSGCPQRPAEGVSLHGGGVGNCKLLSMGAGKEAQVLRRAASASNC